MHQITMKKLGFTDGFAAEAALYGGLFAGRVVFQSREIYQVICENGTLSAEVSGKFRFAAQKPSDFPAVGDFVMLDRDNDRAGSGVIHQRLSRKSVFIRKAAGTGREEQVVACNIDTVFICMSLNNDFNLRRLERYLAISWDSGAVPVVVLTKADLCDDPDRLRRQAEETALGADVLVVSALAGDGRSRILEYVGAGQTAALIGSSGVGKSTLINCLTQENKLETNGLRNDDKGRHTTTRRELILLENGGMVIDTPGMRELGLESADVSKAFGEIDALASECRFHDCTHTREPGCAVRRAVEAGALSVERLLSYQKLKKEARYEGLNFRQIEAVKLDEMFKEVGGMKNARRFAKEKNKRKS